MWDIVWDGKVQTMVNNGGVPKEIQTVPQDSRIVTRMKAKDM